MSVTRNVALTSPKTCGLNVAVIVHDALTASVAPQVLVWVKSVVSPVMEMEFTVTVKGPVLLNRNPCVGAGALLPSRIFPKLNEEGVRDTVAAAPVPVRESVPLALPFIFRVALSAPRIEGVKVIKSVQVAPGPTTPPLVQVPGDSAKSAALVPVMVKNGVLRVRLNVPVLVSVTVIGELGVFC